MVQDPLGVEPDNPQVLQFEVTGAVPDEVVAGQVAHALTLGRPEVAEFEEGMATGTLHIIANGPSARQAPLEGPTLALNGALRLFTERGLAPTFWAACDPQALVADFLTDAPAETVYLVASKCHPSVFEALKDRRVVIWHADDPGSFPLVYDRFPVVSWVSITLCAFELMARIGWRRFEVWGWDGCFLDGQHHAADQAHEAERMEVDLGGAEPVITTPAWMLEAQSAGQRLAGFPFRVHIHGPGLIAQIMRAVMPTRRMTDFDR